MSWSGLRAPVKCPELSEVAATDPYDEGGPYAWACPDWLMCVLDLTTEGACVPGG